MSYPLDSLHREVAYVAYHFHWGREEILELPHAERTRWVHEIGHINRQVNGQGDE